MANNRFVKGERLTPGEVYYAVVGTFVQNDYVLVQKIESTDYQQPIAFVFRSPKDQKLHILYHPAKDNDEPGKDTPLKKLIPLVQAQLDKFKIENVISETDYKNAIEHFIIEEFNKIAVVDVKHYVAAKRENNKLCIEDSIKRISPLKYDVRYIVEAMQADPSNKARETGQQNLTNNWQCGHFVIESIRREIEERPFNENFKVTGEILAGHKKLCDLGSKVHASKEEKAIERKDDFDMDDDVPTDAKTPSTQRSPVARATQLQSATPNKPILPKSDSRREAIKEYFPNLKERFKEASDDTIINELFKYMDSKPGKPLGLMDDTSSHSLYTDPREQLPVFMLDQLKVFLQLKEKESDDEKAAYLKTCDFCFDYDHRPILNEKLLTMNPSAIFDGKNSETIRLGVTEAGMKSMQMKKET